MDNGKNYFLNMSMKYLHTMIRVSDLDKTVDFFVNKLGLLNEVAGKLKLGGLLWCFFMRQVMSRQRLN